jgi:methionine-rich copper-binding protein CopC
MRASAAATLALALALPAGAGAHAFLVRSSPPSRAVLAHPPARVELWFNEGLEPAYSRVSVATDAGVSVDRGDVSVGPEDPRRLSVSVGALAPGRYTVRYRVLSVDGHLVESSFAFTVTAP